MIELKKIRVKNFKCFSEEVELGLGKLTLLTGANSTGKSSLMYSVLGALQSPRFPYEYSANGRYVNMGNFSEMVFHHEKSLPIEIAFSLVENGATYDVETIWINGETNDQAALYKYSVHSTDFDFCISQNREGEDNDYYLSLDYRPKHDDAQRGFIFDLLLDDLRQIADYYKSENQSEEFLKEILAGYDQRTTVENVLFKFDAKGGSCPDNPRASFAFSIVNRLVVDAIHHYQDKMNFISSYRLPAERIYLEESLENGKIQASGKGFVNQLLHWRENDRQYYETLKGVLRTMGVLYDIEPERIGGGQFRVGVTIHKSGPTALLSDVGFGISQLLPVIVGDIELGKESTLFAAQPEIHLHPNAQANYADYLVDQINNGKNYIIETHSEYILNRLRLAIVKGELKEDDIRVYYLSQEFDSTKIFPVQFTKNGQIMGAPNDFFETYMMDVMNIAMEAVE